MYLQVVLVRWQRWRLGASKKWRRANRRSLVVTLIATVLLGLGLRSFVANRSKSFRALLALTPEPPTLPPLSVLHPNTPPQASLNPGVSFSIKSTTGLFPEYSELFPQFGKSEPGQRYRIENTRMLAKPSTREEDSLLLVTVFNDGESWGTNRSAADYFQLVSSLDFPKEKMSIAMLTSSVEEFTKVKRIFSRQIHEYARLSVIFRNDFAQEGLTRLNRHSDKLQSSRRRMLARYRNYALLSNLETWHQHVLWLDADIISIPADLLIKMIQLRLDVVTPMCIRRHNYQSNDSYDYDLNAWVGHRKVRSPGEENFVPGPLSVRNMHNLQGENQIAVPLDSLDLERTKDRKRRSAYRERQRQEKEHLRQEIGKLTEELGHLQNTKERNTLAMPVYWEMMAKRQLQARLNAEAEQRRLYTVIDSQAALIHEFRSYVNEHTKDDSKELLDSDTYCQHKTLCVEPSDVEFYQAYVLDLDALYAKTSTVLSSCVLDKTTACWDDLKQQWREEGTSDFYTFVDVQIVPFGFKETSDTLWTVGRLLHRQEDRQAYHGLPNTVAFKFRYTTQLKSGRVVSVLQRVVSRRYDEDGKTVVVWRSFTEGEGMFTGMHADETGCLPAEYVLIASIVENSKDVTLIEVKEKLLKEYERQEKKECAEGYLVRRSLVVTLIATVLLGLGLRSFVANRSKSFRALLALTPEPPTLPPLSVLHPNTPPQASLNPGVSFSIKSTTGLFPEYSELFPQFGKSEPGQRYRIENTRMLAKPAADYFQLVSSLDFPKEKMSIAMLTSSVEEFTKVKRIFSRQIHEYARLSVIFRNDFAQEGLTRLNRHSDKLQSSRRRMLARYRNYALLSNLETWHQHVLWLDADIISIPADLLIKMIQLRLDVVTPMCIRRYNYQSNDSYDYDLNAAAKCEEYAQSPGENQIAVPLDSVGGTMLYVRADVHRQGVIFPAHYTIGSEWGAEGYDGIETEGFCYNAHFLGFRCWGMPKESIYHAV
ncbi:Mannan polymerase complex subunit mnn9 [Phytophthora cinnamomi]|uniref:Mannan polymerase complex subunit mnn9 n=1 Tax=Phytophthora cinnamomi TaxID=4785 RepID=UPI00355A9EC5|nr:Mannan polymerase complex subunit mnn9 [Phytophthora cinnamomi]